MELRGSTKRILAESSNQNIAALGETDSRKDADYSKGIPVARVNETGRIIYLPFNSTTKVGIFGPSGSGKTVMAKAMASRLHKTGRRIYNGGDVKNDFQSLDYQGGVSKELAEKMGLLKNERPQPIPKKLFMPKFLVNDFDSVPSYIEPFTFGFQDITKDDLKYLLGEGELSGEPDQVMTEILNAVELAETSFEDLLGRIDSHEDANHGTKKTLKTRVKSLRSQEIISNRYRKDPLQYLDQDYAVSLGLKGFRNYQRGSMYMLEFYAAVLLRELKRRATANEIQSSLIGMWAEFHRLAPAGESSLLKPEIQDWIDLGGRQSDLPLILDSQAPSQIPNSHVQGQYDFLGRLSAMFLGCDQNGRPLGENEWKKALKSVNMLTRSNKRHWRRRMNQLDMYDFLFVHPGRHDGPFDCPVVRSLAPLVSHPG